MAKKKLDLGKILCGVAAVFGLVAFLMLFASNIVCDLQELGKVEYSGLHTVFGAEYKSTVLGHETSTKVFEFSFLGFLPYLLALVGIAFSVLALLGKLGKISPIVAAACFVVAAILFFLAPQTCVLADNAEKPEKFYEVYKLGAGAIVAGVFSIISALATGATLLVNKK